MVKKIKKYLKFVVCCALIMSLVAPSYAALSASDGSAFVTKAEFDSALADFNARLTTFEAGINSKIDSQVSSYLDRNGIWNGKVQTLTEAAYKGKMTFMDNWCVPGGIASGNEQNSGRVLTAGANGLSHHILSPAGSESVWRFATNDGYRKGSSHVVIENINKSGLLIGTLCTATWCGGSGSTAANFTPNYNSSYHYLGKFLKDSADWGLQGQAKRLSEYTSDSGYGYIGGIPFAWTQSGKQSFFSSMYVETSLDNFATVNWLTNVSTNKLIKYEENGGNFNNLSWCGTFGNYYDEIEIDNSPKQFLIMCFVAKGDTLKTRWSWKLLGNTITSNPGGCGLLFAPPDADNQQPTLLDAKFFAQCIQFLDCVVY